jgi:hypothetical protein
VLIFQNANRARVKEDDKTFRKATLNIFYQANQSFATRIPNSTIVLEYGVNIRHECCTHYIRST